ncbi:MAG TPA: zinc ribbon domain-containing protein [Nocardioides sp.]|nr:zinc ribbon domain-containing protein [Nocardioides sp.]
MTFCVSCGHELGVGRFCTNCGHPIDRAATDAGWRTDTAQRPAVPPAPRFPLFADEAAPRPAPTPHPEHRQPRPPWGRWALVAAVLAVVLAAVAGLGIWLMAGDDPAEEARPGPRHSSSSGASPSPGKDRPSASVDPSAVTAGATVTVPATAPPGQDVTGNPVDYEAENMLDAVPETTWRMPGDGTGAELELTLAAPTRLRSVGLINGYAKTARDARGRDLDWYHGNRRIEAVEWVFDDGTTIGQDLEDSPSLQTVDVEVTPTTITLLLVAVSAPGTGRAARDYTAISDVSLVGAD